MLTNDELEQWRAHPATERVLAALQANATARAAAVAADFWDRWDPADRELVRRRDLALAWREVVLDLMECEAEKINEWTNEAR